MRFLKNLKLNSGLKKLCSGSFSGSELKTLHLPCPMPEVGDGALYCSWGMTVYLPDGLEAIESNWFSTSAVGSVFIPQSVA